MKCEEEEKDRIEQLKKWLDKNTIVVSEPKEVTLYDFNVNWESWAGVFKVDFDNIAVFYTFTCSIQATGHPGFCPPLFISPLGEPASYVAVQMTDKTREAILNALKLTFPKLKPLGRNRETGIEITYDTPMHARLELEEVKKVRELVAKSYSITTPLAGLG